MRISDWSSDVCSSDLAADVSVVLDRRADLPFGLYRRAVGGVCRGADGVEHRYFLLELAQAAGEHPLRGNVVEAQEARGHVPSLELGRASCRERVCHDV